MAPCASCGEETNKSWTGCADMLSYTNEEGGSVYCNTECQATHHLDHETLFHAREQRRILLRIATIAKSAIVAYLECTFDRHYHSILVANNMLLILEGRPAIRRHIPFPSDLTTNVEYKMAVLMFMQCTLAVTLISTLAKQLLKDHCFTVHVVGVKVVAEPNLMIRVYREPGSGATDLLMRGDHTALMVTTTSGEQWVIDSSGCQYGFQDILVPLHKYLEGKRLLGTPEQYEHYHEVHDIDHPKTVRLVQLDPLIQEEITLERPARLHFAKLIKRKIEKEGINFSENLLSGSDKKFEEKVACFVQEIKAHMTEYVEETYGQEGLEDLQKLSGEEVQARWTEELGVDCEEDIRGILRLQESLPIK